MTHRSVILSAQGDPYTPPDLTHRFVTVHEITDTDETFTDIAPVSLASIFFTDRDIFIDLLARAGVEHSPDPWFTPAEIVTQHPERSKYVWIREGTGPNNGGYHDFVTCFRFDPDTERLQGVDTWE